MIGQLRYLILVAGSLAGVLALELRGTLVQRSLPILPPAALAPEAANHPIAEPPSEAEISALSATILARPLFSPNRRPMIPAKPNSAAPPAPPRLSGIIIYDKQRLAFFAGGGADKSIVAARGASIGRWRVMAIEPGRVLLIGPKGAQYLYPSFASAPDAAHPPMHVGPPDPVLPTTQAALRALLLRLSHDPN